MRRQLLIWPTWVRASARGPLIIDQNGWGPRDAVPVMEICSSSSSGTWAKSSRTRARVSIVCRRVACRVFAGAGRDASGSPFVGVSPWPPSEKRGNRRLLARDTAAAAAVLASGLALASWQLLPFLELVQDVHRSLLSSPERFADMYRALRPGGVLGVVDHRLPADREAPEKLRTGYIHEQTVIDLAKKAGFVLEDRSPVNDNAKDTADHPFGVWTLPPVARTSGFGEPDDPDFDRSKYDAIGESDRFTLRFRKPRS